MINHQESPSYAAVASQQPPLVADVFVAIEVERPDQMSTVVPP
jgi:hypothetical protein